MQSFAQYEIDINKYEFKGEIQHGAFGMVSKIVEKNTNNIFAAKIINKEKLNKKLFDAR